MKAVKKVSKILNPPAPKMVGDGFRVHNFFPNGNKLDMSPFYLLDYNAKLEFSARNTPRGVGVHPHRGFETVTIVYEGAVAHHDSAGNSGAVFPGDVQWMTAGNGILHKEYHEESFSKKGGIFQMVQLWVNLPAVYKKVSPNYQELKKNQIPLVELPNKSGTLAVIAGNFRGTKGVATTFSPLEIYNLKLSAGSQIDIDLPADYNTCLLIIDGEITINGAQTALVNQLATFATDGDSFKVDAISNSTLLLLSGAPINEPIAAYGPFLMNTEEEIQQAIADYNEGRFGYLEE